MFSKHNFILFSVGVIFGLLLYNSYSRLDSVDQILVREENQPEDAELLSSESVWGSIDPGLPIEAGELRASLRPEDLYHSDGRQSIYQPEFIEYQVVAGDTLSSVWAKFGSDLSYAIAAEQALKKADLSSGQILQKGATLKINATEQVVQEIIKTNSEGASIRLTYLPGEGEYEITEVQPDIITEDYKVSLKIQHSIAATASQNDLPYEIVDELVDIFGSKIEFTRDIHPGDAFAVVYERRQLLDGRSLTPGKIHAASITNRGKTFIAINIPNDLGKNQYYDQEGVAIGNFFLRYPLKFSRISSVFTNSRFHPVLKTRRPHNGVDFAAPTGTPVRAVADATVEAAAYHRANGNWVKLRHSSKYSTAYLHLSKIEKGIRAGGKVSRGDLIGYVGSTGLSSGPHLHYSFYVNGQYVDPLKVELPVLDSQKISPTHKEFKKYLTMLLTAEG